jgi:hypothetical protein
MKKTPKMLYKYVTPERVDVLERLKIRFTQGSQLNDPYECTPIFSEAYPSDALAKASRPPTGHGFIEFHPRPGVAPFDNINPQEKAKVNHLIVELMRTILRDVILILSLSDKRDNLAMWAHYTSNHQGLVIGFDAHHRFFLRNNRASGGLDLAAANKVFYTRRRPQFKFVTEISKSAAFFTKSPEWQYEGEWRMLRNIEDEHEVIYNGIEPIYLFTVPPDAVRCVILGAASSVKTQERIVSAVRGNAELSHVQLLKAENDKHSFKLLIKDLA